MPTFDMFHASVMFRIIGHVDGCFIIHVKIERTFAAKAELASQIAEVYGFLSSFRSSHDFCLTAGKSDGRLLLGAPR